MVSLEAILDERHATRKLFHQVRVIGEDARAQFERVTWRHRNESVRVFEVDVTDACAADGGAVVAHVGEETAETRSYPDRTEKEKNSSDLENKLKHNYG